MAKLYFAKMNINEDIYDVYNGVLSLDDLLEKIYIGVNNKTQIHDENGGRYKFFDLDKYDGNIISGRLGFIKAGIHSTYDPENDTAIDTVDENKLEYITFYIDVYKEILAFTVTPSLTKRKVLEKFAGLIKKETDIGVVFMLEANIRRLEKELERMNVLKNVSLNLVPPNGDKKQFGSLFSLEADVVSESGATKLTQTYSTKKKEGLKKASKLILNLIQGIKLGYAKGTFTGRDEHREIVEINTEDDTPYYKNIHSDQNKNKMIIAEKGRAGVVDIMAYKAKSREKNNEGERKQK